MIKSPEKTEYKAAVLSDTHSHLSHDALRLMQDADFILHAGDIGNMEILRTLEATAPVYAVRGNMDSLRWAGSLPVSETIEIAQYTICITHDLTHTDIDFEPLGADVVIHGHTHRPSIRKDSKGILFINPGSISQPRTHAGSSFAWLYLGKKLKAEIVYLD